MKRTAKLAVAVLALVALVALTACAPQTMSGGGKVWGYVASPKDAKLDVAESQTATSSITVGEVSAPGGAWLVVHEDDNGKPGKRVGLVHIDKGDSTNVDVALTDVTTPSVIVAVHADKGTAGEFDFDMMKTESSPDRPYFVNEKELAKVVTLQAN